MQSSATRRDPVVHGEAGEPAGAPPQGRAQQSGRLRSRNRLLASLLAGVAVFAFAIVISLAIVLHYYGKTHGLIAGL